MRLISALLAPVLLISGLAVAPAVMAPIASAGCVKSSGITVCDQDGGSGTGPTVPYPCEYDWYCYDGSTWDLNLDVDVPPPPRPDISPPRPDVGRPGTPGGGIGGRR